MARRVWYRYKIRNPRLPKYRKNGKLFYKQGRFRGLCSATVVGSSNLSIVFTAAHCIRESGPSGRFYDDWVFVPGFDRGRRPFGMFPYREAYVLSGWTTTGSRANPNRNYDVGALVLSRNRSGAKVEAAVGSLGIATGYTRQHYWHVFGYPASKPFTGSTLWTCESPSYGADFDQQKRPGPNPTEIACDLTGGSSGGGWIWQKPGGRYLNGVMSYGPPWPSRDSFGTYFGSAVWKLYQQVSRIRAP